MSIKIPNNFGKIIKSKTIIPFPVFIPANLLNLVLDFALIIAKIKNDFNLLFFFIVNND